MYSAHSIFKRFQSPRRYEAVLNGGMAKGNLNEEFPEYNDNYCVRYPSGFKYGSSDVCADMIFCEYEADDKPYPGYTTDTKLKENRAYDKGRLYIFAVPEIGPKKLRLCDMA